MGSEMCIRDSTRTVNYIRLQIFPDGGVARLRLFGEVKYDWGKFKNNELIELSSLNLGGSIVAFNNAHYGDVSALLSEGRGKTMGDGWETRRRREPGNDWIIIKLAKKAMIKEIEILSPSSRAGIMIGDLILRVNGTRIFEFSELKHIPLLPISSTLSKVTSEELFIYIIFPMFISINGSI